MKTPSDKGFSAAAEQHGEVQPARWGGVFAMTLCVFALIASEFMPVSLLTPMASDLKISEGMAGRALIGGVVDGFWSLSAATAMQLVPADQVPRALAILNGGNALATVVAAPLGSYLGSITGWRGAFFCLVPIALIAFAWQWFSLPSMAAKPRTPDSSNVDSSGYQSTFAVSAGLLLAAAVLACWTARADRTP